MKIVISERQYKLLNEGDSPIKIGCHDFGKIPKICGTLKLTKQHGDILISNNREIAKKDLMNKLDNFIESAKKETGEYKKITDKFTNAVEISKNEIIKYLDNNYPNAMYSTIGIQERLDANKIMSDLVKILYDAFVEVWDDSYVIRNIADFFVTKKNIGNVLKESKTVWDKWLNMFLDLIENYFVDNTFLLVSDFTRNLNKSSSLPICKKVIITENIVCKKLPQKEWYHPKIKYVFEYALDKYITSSNVLISINRIYWTKVSSILKKLV